MAGTSWQWYRAEHSLAAEAIQRTTAEENTRKAEHGPDHPDTHRCMAHLGNCYYSLKRLDKSVPLFAELLLLFEKNLGRDHQSTQLMVAIREKTLQILQGLAENKLRINESVVDRVECLPAVVSATFAPGVREQPVRNGESRFAKSIAINPWKTGLKRTKPRVFTLGFVR